MAEMQMRYCLAPEIRVHGIPTLPPAKRKSLLLRKVSTYLSILGSLDDLLHAYPTLLERGNRTLACFRETKLFLDLGTPIGSSISYGFLGDMLHHSLFIKVLRASPKLLVSNWLEVLIYAVYRVCSSTLAVCRP